MLKLVDSNQKISKDIARAMTDSLNTMVKKNSSRVKKQIQNIIPTWVREQPEIQEILQEAPVEDLCFSIPKLIAYCSEWTPLNPGDILITGTPGGVGRVRKPPIWMKPNDIVEVDISGVGILKNTIIDE